MPSQLPVHPPTQPSILNLSPWWQHSTAASHNTTDKHTLPGTPTYTSTHNLAPLQHRITQQHLPMMRLACQHKGLGDLEGHGPESTLSSQRSNRIWQHNCPFEFAKTFHDFNELLYTSCCSIICNACGSLIFSTMCVFTKNIHWFTLLVSVRPAGRPCSYSLLACLQQQH